MSMSNELRNIVIIFLVKTEIIVTVVTVSFGFFGEQHNNEDYVLVLPILPISTCSNSLTVCLVQFYIMVHVCDQIMNTQLLQIVVVDYIMLRTAFSS